MFGGLQPEEHTRLKLRVTGVVGHHASARARRLCEHNALRRRKQDAPGAPGAAQRSQPALPPQWMPFIALSAHSIISS